MIDCEIVYFSDPEFEELSSKGKFLKKSSIPICDVFFTDPLSSV